MRSNKIRAMLAIGCVSLLALSVPAFSRPSPRGLDAEQAQTHGSAHKSKQARKAKNQKNKKAAPEARLHSMRIEEPPARPLFGWPALVTEARKYLGTNPTGQKKLWCARFMNLVLGKLGYAGTHSDAAKSFASYGHRIDEPKVGAIAVLNRGKNGGHVGVVTGIDKSGNPIIVSGNHGHSVGEAIYPRNSVVAYVMPSDSPHPTMVASRTTPDRPSEISVDSPIAELIKAIESEQDRAEAPATPPAPPVPHRTVQQTAQAPVPAPQQRQAPAQNQRQPVAAAHRDLPLDPTLARILGVKQNAKPAPAQPAQPQRRVEQAPQSRVASNGGGLAGLFSR